MANVDVNKPNMVFFKPTETPTQMFKNEFPLFGSKEISSGSVAFEMIFEALKSELFRF